MINKKISIFLGFALLGTCQSVLAMHRYTKKLSAAPALRAALRKKECCLSIYPPALFIHAAVQAAQTTKHKEELQEHIKCCWPDGSHGRIQIYNHDFKKFYHHVTSYLPWDGTHKKGSYSLLLNEREVMIQAYSHQYGSMNPCYIDVFAQTDLLEDVKHHEKILQQFNKLIELPVADSFQIHQREYDGIKDAVFAKRGKRYAELFDILYPHATHQSVIALSKEFDEGSCHTWQETYPPTSSATINGKKFWIGGKIGAIIYDHQNR